LASKLVFTSIILIAVGLVLVVISDPLLRAVTGAGTGGFAPGGGGFTGNFTRGSFNSTQFATFRRASGLAGMTAIESLAGIALVAAGLLLEVFSIFIVPKPTQPQR